MPALVSVTAAGALNESVSVYVVRIAGVELPMVVMPHSNKALRPLCLTLFLGLPMVFELEDPAVAATSFCLGMLAIGLLFLALLTDPGILPPAINPDRASGRQKLSDFLTLPAYRQELATGTYCRTCCHVRPSRSSHCRLCNVCVTEHDHHCFILGCCIGARNMRWFLAYMAATTAAGVYTCYKLLIQTLDLVQRSKLNAHSAAAPALSVAIASCFTLVMFAFTLRVYYVVICAGGTTRHGPSVVGGSKPVQRGFFERMSTMVWPEVASMIPDYVAALNRFNAEASKADTAAVDIPQEQPLGGGGGRYMSAAHAAPSGQDVDDHQRTDSIASATRHDDSAVDVESVSDSQPLVGSKS